MKEAIKEAKKAEKHGEVPIGAVVVLDGKIIGRGRNRREKGDATAHAEIEAIRKACRKNGGWRLSGAEIYVTLEPCLMCYGAILNARISRLYYGTADDKISVEGVDKRKLCDAKFNGLNHNLEVVNAVMENECSQMLGDFFKKVREPKSIKNKDKNCNKYTKKS